MTSPRGESRNIQQIVRNVYDSFNKTAACLCAPLPAPDAGTAFCSSCSVASHTACMWGKDAR